MKLSAHSLVSRLVYLNAQGDAARVVGRDDPRMAHVEGPMASTSARHLLKTTYLARGQFQIQLCGLVGRPPVARHHPILAYWRSTLDVCAEMKPVLGGWGGVGVKSDAAMSYTRDLAERITGVRPEPDHDGDLPIRVSGALFFARIVGESDSWVQVFSVAVAEIDHSGDLAIALNDINSRLRFARTFWTSGQVLFESEIWSDDLNPANFGHACRNIAGATDEFGPQLISAFGGTPMFQQSKDDRYQENWAAEGLGFYL